MPNRNDAILEAAGIVSANKLRQLEEAGLTVVWRDELERLEQIEDGLKAMLVRMKNPELVGAAIQSVAKYGKLYKELAESGND